MSKFKVGMKVWCPRFGDGTIVGNFKETKYPITVAFNHDERVAYFTGDGKESQSHAFPSLFIGHKKDVLKVGVE